MKKLDNIRLPMKARQYLPIIKDNAGDIYIINYDEGKVLSLIYASRRDFDGCLLTKQQIRPLLKQVESMTADQLTSLVIGAVYSGRVINPLTFQVKEISVQMFNVPLKHHRGPRLKPGQQILSHAARQRMAGF